MITISPEEWADLVRRVEAVETAATAANALGTAPDCVLIHLFEWTDGYVPALRAIYDLGRQHGKAGQ